MSLLQNQMARITIRKKFEKFEFPIVMLNIWPRWKRRNFKILYLLDNSRTCKITLVTKKNAFAWRHKNVTVGTDFVWGHSIVGIWSVRLTQIFNIWVFFKKFPVCKRKIKNFKCQWVLLLFSPLLFPLLLLRVLH